MKFILSLPPTTNNIYRTTRTGGFYMTPEAKQWKETAQWKMKVINHADIIEDPVEVTYTFHLKRDRDVDNLKLLQDALEDVVIKNDKQVTAMHVYKKRGKPKVEVDVRVL